MANKKKNSVSSKATAIKVQRDSERRELNKLIEFFSRHKKISPNQNGKIRSIKKLRLEVRKLEKSYIANVKADGGLDSLKQHLKSIGMSSLEEFFDAIDLTKFLTTNFNPGGKINEVLVLKNKAFIKMLIEKYADTEFLNLRAKKNEVYQAELLNLVKQAGNSTTPVKLKSLHDIASSTADSSLSWAIFNKNKQPVDLDTFKNIPTKLVTEFKTNLSNNPSLDPFKEYFDFGLVKYDSKAGKLLILSPGELKSPTNSADLLDQFARMIRRLNEGEDISFMLDGKIISVKTNDVYLVRDNSIGITYGDIKLAYDYMDVTGNSVKNPNVLERGADVRVKFTRSADPSLFFRIKVEYRSISPAQVEKNLIRIKKTVGLKHKT